MLMLTLATGIHNTKVNKEVVFICNWIFGNQTD